MADFGRVGGVTVSHESLCSLLFDVLAFSFC